MHPEEYGLPFDEWRPNQYEVIQTLEELAARDDQAAVIIEAPTGFGKSALPAALAYSHKVVAVTITTDLQAQYEKFGFKVVYGKARYPCVYDDFINTWERRFGRSVNAHGVLEPSAADCDVEQCPVKMQCPYERAKRVAMSSNKLVLNVHYAFYTNWWRKRRVRFFDEAHQLPPTLTSIGSFSVADRTLRRYGLAMPDFVGGAGWAINGMREWLDQAAASLSCSGMEGRDLVSCLRFRLRLQRIRDAFAQLRAGEAYISTGEKLEIKTVSPVFYAPRILGNDTIRVLMSATIGDPYVLAGELGLTKYEFITIPHPFPEERRPVLFVEDAPAMSGRSTPSDWKRLAGLVETILRARPDDKGIVHVSSWKQAERLRKLLAGTGVGRRCFVPSQQRAGAIRRFKQSPDPLIAISPSWREGIDLPDDDARLSIIAKMPFPNLGDPVVKLRTRKANGWPWYYWRTALGVVQAAGRVVRHADDYGETFILDSNWSRVKRYAPAWFKPLDLTEEELNAWLARPRLTSASRPGTIDETAYEDAGLLW